CPEFNPNQGTFYEGAIAKWEENVEEKPVTNRNRPCSLNTNIIVRQLQTDPLL
ncbi:LOW QUALITY PROTEIN: hypothetical protein TorRG33x02_121970, partial [Trema orientale]